MRSVTSATCWTRSRLSDRTSRVSAWATHKQLPRNSSSKAANFAKRSGSKSENRSSFRDIRHSHGQVQIISTAGLVSLVRTVFHVGGKTMAGKRTTILPVVALFLSFVAGSAFAQFKPGDVITYDN